MRIAMNLTIDGHSPIPIRRQLTEQLKHAIESGGGARVPSPPYIPFPARLFFAHMHMGPSAREGFQQNRAVASRAVERGVAAPRGQGGSGDRAPRGGASRAPPPFGRVPAGEGGGRGLRRRRKRQ